MVQHVSVLTNVSRELEKNVSSAAVGSLGSHLLCVVFVGGSAGRHPPLAPFRRHLHPGSCCPWCVPCSVCVGPGGTARLLFEFAHVPSPASGPAQLGENLAVTWEAHGHQMTKGSHALFLGEMNTFP